MIASEHASKQAKTCMFSVTKAIPCKSVVAAVARDTAVCERAVAQHHMGCVYIYTNYMRLH